MGLSLDDLAPPLDDIAYLSRSNNRIATLQALGRQPRPRRSLAEAIGASRPTIGRILDGFEDRGWVIAEAPGNGHNYRVTPLGEVVLDAFTRLMDTVETVQQLRELAPRIPFEELDLDPRLLADARITTPTATDATAHTRREAALLEHTSSIRFLCNQSQPETVTRYRDWALGDDREFDAVITGDAIDAALADDAMKQALVDLAASSGARIHRYEGQVSAMLGVFDDIATIVPLDDMGVPVAFIETESSAVRAAVAETLAGYRERSTPLDGLDRRV